MHSSRLPSVARSIAVVLFAAACASREPAEPAAPVLDLVADRSVPVGLAPHGMGFADGKVYVAVSGEDAVVRLDLETLERELRLDAPGVPLDVRVVGDELLVPQFSRSTVLRLDRATGEPLGSLEVGDGPSLFNVRQAAQAAWIVCERADRAALIGGRPPRVQRTLEVGDRPYPGEIRIDARQLFVPLYEERAVAVFELETSRRIATVPLDDVPQGGDVTLDGRFYLVALRDSSSVAVIDTISHEVVLTIEEGIGPDPFAVGIPGDGRYAYVNNAGGDTLSRIDLATWRVDARIRTGAQPIVMREHGNSLYVTNEVDGTLSVIRLP